jgi:hypothetical protein
LSLTVSLQLGARLTEHDHAFKAEDLLRHPALKFFIGALEERPHDRMVRAIADNALGFGVSRDGPRAIG